MENIVKVEEKEDYVLCKARPFDLTAENILPFIQEVLGACRSTNKNLVFIDFTANCEETSATLKAVAGIMAEQHLRTFHSEVGRIPRIAFLGVPPTVSTYRPTEEILQGAGMPFAVFTEEEEAKKWLFQEQIF